MLNLACFLSVKLILKMSVNWMLWSSVQNCLLSVSFPRVSAASLTGRQSEDCILCSGVEQPRALQGSPGKALSLPQSLSQNPAEEQLSGDCVYGQRLKGCLLLGTHSSHDDDDGDDDQSCSVHLCQTLCPRTLQPSIIHLALQSYFERYCNYNI